MLRNPQERYLSEFQHAKKGATWSDSITKCLEQNLYKQNCYLGFENWRYVFGWIF